MILRPLAHQLFRTPRPVSVLAAFGTGLVLLALWIPHTPALMAQTAPPGDAARMGPGFEAGAGITFQTFRFSDEAAAGLESISLLSTPLATGVRFGPRFRARLTGAWARGTLDGPDGGQVSIEGLTDTRLSVDAEVVPGALTLTGSVSLSTGIDGFTTAESELAGAVASDLLPFRISNWGSGGGGGLALTAVRDVGDTGLGLSAGVHRAGEFTPTSESPAAYRPGTSLSLGAAVDRVVGPGGKATLQANVSRFGDGELDGENVFRSGTRVGVTGSYSFPAGVQTSGLVYTGYRYRSRGTFLLDLDDRPSQGVFVVGGGVRTPALGGILTPSAEFRALRREDGQDQGWRLGAGISSEWTTGAGVVQPGLRLHLGNARIRDGVDTGFTGLDLSFQLRRTAAGSGGGS